jgi:kynureninase
MVSNEFILPRRGVYMCGHSLGPMTKIAENCVKEALLSWGDQAVAGWNDQGWIELPYQVATLLAPLLGANSDEVILSDSTSINLYKVLMSALKMQSNRKVILSTHDNFPADLYVAEGIGHFLSDYQLKVVSLDELKEHLDDSVAVVLLTHINYRDASAHDMSKVTKMAHDKGILTVWDLSHSAGIIPLSLREHDVDFAVGCTYKYLNGGPGSPGFIYVNSKHQSSALSPIFGWMGHKRPFEFSSQYSSTGIRTFLGGTPYVLSLIALKGALSVFKGVSMTKLYAKSQRYSEYLLNSLRAKGLKVLSSINVIRGGHVSFLHEYAYGFSRALIDQGVVCDYRDPSLIRLCVNPLYLDFDAILQCLDSIDYVLERKTFLLPKYQQKLKVT